MGFTVSGDRLPFFIQMKQMQDWRRTQLLAKEAQMQERNAQKQKRKRDAREAADRRLKARSERLKAEELAKVRDEVMAKARADAAAIAIARAEAEVKSRAQPEGETEGGGDAKPASEPKTEPERNAEAKPEAEAERSADGNSGDDEIVEGGAGGVDKALATTEAGNATYGGFDDNDTDGSEGAFDKDDEEEANGDNSGMHSMMKKLLPNFWCTRGSSAKHSKTKALTPISRTMRIIQSRRSLSLIRGPGLCL